MSATPFAVFRRLERVAASVTRGAADEEQRRRLLLMWGISVGGIIPLTLFAAVGFLQGRTTLGTADLLAALLLSANLLHGWVYQRFGWNIAFGMVCTGALFAFLFVTGSADNTAFVWYFTFPLVAFYMLGCRHGTVAVLLMAVPPLAVAAFGGDLPWIARYRPDLLLRFVPSFFVVSLFSFLFEWSRQRNYTELQASKNLLEHKVEERTEELRAANTSLEGAYEALQKEVADRKQVEDRLRQAQKMEAVGTLAGGIAHDFNNMLGAILGFTELTLTRDDLPLEARDHLQGVLSAALRARDLVRQILVFSRKGEEPRETIALRPLIEEAGKLLRQTIPANIEIRMDLEDGDVSVFADRTQLYQVLMNLGTNAYHAMPDGGGVLHVRLRHGEAGGGRGDAPAELADGPYAVVTIADTGVGMTAATVSRIFEPFFTTKPLGEGTGMGLSVVHGIVTRHGGAIQVESRPGAGTTFNVFLPRVAAQLRDDAPVVAAVPGSGEHVLVVDDEPLLAGMLRRSLEGLGYRVTVAGGPEQALEAFRTGEDGFDLLLTDQAMPGMTGAVLAGEVLKDRPGFPVIICTGYSEVLGGRTAEELGVGALLTKPVDRVKLSKVLRRVLGVAT